MKFQDFIGKMVDKLFFMVWAPYGEDSLSDIDISFGFIFKEFPNQLLIVTTDIKDIWTPIILEKEIPTNLFTFNDFEVRMQQWMKCELTNIDYEYYDVTHEVIFKDFISNKILSIEYIQIKNDKEFGPFGVKIYFANNYIISIPGTDGNIIETKDFFKFNNIKGFQQLGEIVNTSISDYDNITGHKH